MNRFVTATLQYLFLFSVYKSAVMAHRCVIAAVAATLLLGGCLSSGSPDDQQAGNALWYTDAIAAPSKREHQDAVVHAALSTGLAALHDRAFRDRLPAATAAEEADTAGSVQLDELHELLMEHFETVRGLRLDAQLGDGQHFAPLSPTAARDTLFFGLGAGGVGVFRECLLPFSRSLLPSSIGRGKDAAPFSDADALTALLLSTALGVSSPANAAVQPAPGGSAAAARRLIARETARLAHSAFWFATLPTHCPLHATHASATSSSSSSPSASVLPSGVHSRLLYLTWIIMLTDERYLAPFDLVWVQGLRAQALLLESLLPRMAAKGHLAYVVLADQDSEAVQRISVPAVLSEQEQQAHASAASSPAFNLKSRAALLQVNFTSPAAEAARNGRPLLLWLGAPPHLHVHTHAHGYAEGETGQGTSSGPAASPAASSPSEVALVPAGVEANARIAFFIRNQLFDGHDEAGANTAAGTVAPWELLRPALAAPRARRSRSTPAAAAPAADVADAAAATTGDAVKDAVAITRARAAAAAAASAAAARAESELSSHHEAASRDTAALQDLIEAMHREAAEAAEAGTVPQGAPTRSPRMSNPHDDEDDGYGADGDEDRAGDEQDGDAGEWAGDDDDDDATADSPHSAGASGISDADLEAALADMMATSGRSSSDGGSSSESEVDADAAASGLGSDSEGGGSADGFRWASDSAHFGRYEYLLGERLRRDAAGAAGGAADDGDSDEWEPEDWDAEGRQEL